jgi:RNA polymerase sigma-70 factor, ECF subfamily
VNPLATTLTVHITASDVESLYLRHGAELRQAMARLAPELDADDLLQELFVVALRRVDALSAADSKRAWLFGVALRLAGTRRRTARVRRFFGLEAVLNTPGVDTTTRTMEQREAQEVVARTLKKLSAVRREVLVLFELQGLSGVEIAEALEIPLKTVWTRLFHARRQFAEQLETPREGWRAAPEAEGER